MSEDEVLVDAEDVPDPELNRITNAILGAAIAVHRALGPIFPETVYGKALAIEFTVLGIRFRAECPVQVVYRGELVGTGKVDFPVGEKVIVEIKTVDSLAPIHTAQLISYLRATKCKLGLLINFNVRRLKDGIKRIAA